MKNIFLYKYEYEYYDSIDNETIKSKGIVAGTSYANAMSRLEKISTAPHTEHSDLISVSLEELDSYDGKGIIEKEEIDYSFKEEQD